MLQTLRHIGIVFLASLYLAMAVGAAVQIVQPSYTGAGPSAFAPVKGIPKDIPKKSFTPRRHVPLVKQILVSSEYCVKVEAPPTIPHQTLVQFPSSFSSYRSYLFSSFCNRAPPLA